MPNSDNTFGTFNKMTIMHTQADGGVGKNAFPDVAAAQAYIYSTEALAVFDECATTIQWALVADGNGDNTDLKVTLDFGTKGVGTSEADDWAGQFVSRSQALMDASNWILTQVGSVTGSTQNGFTCTKISSHLF